MARPISGGSDAAVDDPPVDTPAEAPPADPPAETVEERLARLERENAALAAETRVLRETRREPAPTPDPKPAADPIAAEYAEIQKRYAAGEFSEDERQIRLGALGAKAEYERRAAETREAEARERDAQARNRGGQRVAAYIQKHPGLKNPQGAEMQRVMPHLSVVVEETGWDQADPRAQALALERTFGPLDRPPIVDTREYERRRHPGGGGGNFGGDDTPPHPSKPKSKGEQIFDRLLPEYQEFFISTRGSKEAAIKTLEYADEHQMRKQGRFR